MTPAPLATFRTVIVTTKRHRLPGRLAIETGTTPETAFTDPRQIARLSRALVRTDPREHFLAFYLDNASRLLAAHVVSIGVANGTEVHPREVFLPAVHLGATSIVVAHNHPSGSVAPSREDLTVTERLRDAGTLLGIDLLDHVIFSQHEKSLYSFTAGTSLQG